MVTNQRKLKPFANVPGIRCLCHELPSELFYQQKHIFTDSVDEHQFREIDD
jgi:hypothetical protein